MLVALCAGCGLALLLAGTAASSSSEFPGSWTLSNGKVVDTETNASGQPVQYFYLVLPSGVTITAGSASGFDCQPGQPKPPGGTNVIECAGTWANGQQVVLTLTVTGLQGSPTFQKYVSFDGSTYQGPFDVPPASTTTTTTTTETTTTTTTNPPPPPQNCKCFQLLAHALGFGFGHNAPGGGTAPAGGPVVITFEVRWTLTCTKGDGGCAAVLQVVPPPGHNGQVSISQTRYRLCRTCHLQFKNPTPGVSKIMCTGKCGEAVVGLALVRVHTDDTLDQAHLVNTDLTFTLKRTCQGKQLRRQLFIFHFGPHGNFEPKRSLL